MPNNSEIAGVFHLDHSPGLQIRYSSFWMSHLVLPAAFFITCMLLIPAFHIDLKWADRLYGWEGGHWRLQTHFITSTLLHTYGQRLSILLGVVTLFTGFTSLFWSPLKPYRRGFGFVIAAMLFSLLLVSLSKHSVPIPCPWDMQRYGGSLPLGGWLHYQFIDTGKGGCFPAGHAAGGFCLLAWYFFARHYQFKRSVLYLLPGLIVGMVFATAQELRGAHFISHDVMAAATCWFFSLFCYRLILLPSRPELGRR